MDVRNNTRPTSHVTNLGFWSTLFIKLEIERCILKSKVRKQPFCRASASEFKYVIIRVSWIKINPGFYTVDGQVLRLAPTGTVTIRLTKSFCPLSASVPYNWLLREHPDVYLYGALLQAAPFLRDDERIPVWRSFFIDAINSINQREIRRQIGGVLRVQSGPTP